MRLVCGDPQTLKTKSAVSEEAIASAIFLSLLSGEALLFRDKEMWQFGLWYLQASQT